MSLRARPTPESEKKDAPLLLAKVFWTKHPNAGPEVAQFKIRIEVFFEEGDFNYSNWRYQQSAYDETIIKAGKGAGWKDKTTWSKEEPYTPEWSESDKRYAWVFIDQPGYSKNKGLAADSDIDYKFAAKWKIWNVETGEEVTIGPYYGQILGAHERTYTPDDFSFVIKIGKVTLTCLNGLEKAKPTGCPW